jgi:nucleotide-binding universal stress UspA family protein
MTILLGTDFSPHSEEALRAAAALAKRSSEEVALLHVSAFLGWQASESAQRSKPEISATRDPSQLASALDAVRLDLEQRLERATRSLERAGVKSTSEMLQGTPDEILVERAAVIRARCIVIGALGRRSPEQWSLGGTADRVAARASVPVLVVRRAQPIVSWCESGTPLRILLGVDDSLSCDKASAALADFVASSPCAITGVHVYWPPEQRAKTGSRGPVPLGSGNVDVERALRSDLEKRVARCASARGFALRMVGGLGRPADHLVHAASELGADLIVVGNHQRTGLDRFWNGSVSRGVIERAETNVLCVPWSS